MNDRERDRLLERLYQQSGTVGRSVPETVVCEGETVPVRERYFALADAESLSDDQREAARELLRTLRRERLRLVQRLREDDLDYATGEDVVERVWDLDRAINAVESLEDPGLSEQCRREEIRSAQQLVDLMRAFGKK